MDYVDKSDVEVLWEILISPNSMKTLDIFHTWFIIYVFVTKIKITFLNTFNFCFQEKNYTVMGGGAFSPTLPQFKYRLYLSIYLSSDLSFSVPCLFVIFDSENDLAHHLIYNSNHTIHII